MANVVVTGANRGIGLQFVKQLAGLPKTSRVFAICRNPDQSEHLHDLKKANDKIKIIKAEMTDFGNYSKINEDITSQLDGTGINMLVNNAGIMLKDTLNSVSVENITKTFNVNSLAPLMLTKTLLPLLKKAEIQNSLVSTGKSIVVNISAQLGSIQENTTSGYVSYRISKAALNMITKSLSVELKSSGIFVLALHPGWVKTDMGGTNAPITAEDSVKSMLKNVFSAEKKHSGCLLGHDMQIIPW